MHLPESVNKLSEKQELGSQIRLIYLLAEHIARPYYTQGTHLDLFCKK